MSDMSQHDYHLTCLNVALRQDGYKTRHVRSGHLIKITTPGWQYLLRLDGAGCRIEPENTSRVYQTLCDRVRHHLKKIAIGSKSALIPLVQDMPWRSIVLWEPWATLVALKLKTYETRPKSINWINYRGVLLIQAAATWKPEGLEFLRVLNDEGHRFSLTDFSPGHIVAMTHMTDCQPTQSVVASVGKNDLLMGNWEDDRWAITLSNVRALPRPIPHVSGEGLRKVPVSLQERVMKSIGHPFRKTG